VDELRAKILSIYGVTEADIAALNVDGYLEAKALADAQYAAFKAELPFRYASVAARLTEEMGLPGPVHVVWSDSAPIGSRNGSRS
jgi:hypothetical protein